MYRDWEYSLAHQRRLRATASLDVIMATRQQCSRCGNALLFRISKDEADEDGKVYIDCADCGANLYGADDVYQHMEDIPPNKYEGS